MDQWQWMSLQFDVLPHSKIREKVVIAHALSAFSIEKLLPKQRVLFSSKAHMA
jgi:hypothetical protein